MSIINLLTLLVFMANQLSCIPEQIEDSSLIKSNSAVIGSVQHAPYIYNSENYDERVIIENLSTTAYKSEIIQANGYFKFSDLGKGEYKIQIERFQSTVFKQTVLEKHFILDENSIILIPITFKPVGGVDYKIYPIKYEDSVCTGGIVGKIDFNSKSIINNEDIIFIENNSESSKSLIYLESLTDANSEKYRDSLDVNNSFAFQKVALGIYILKFNKDYYNNGQLIETVSSGNIYQLVVLPNLKSVISINSLVTNKQNRSRPKFDAPYIYQIWSPEFKSE